jgi:hypothetical protein
VLERGGDVAVLLAEHEPRRNVLPQRVRAGRLLQRLEGDRPLGDGHPRGLGGRHVGGELVVEQLRRDPEIGRAVAARGRPHRVAEGAARVLAREVEAALADSRREAADVDEAGDLAGIGGDVGDHEAPVGVADEDDRFFDGSNDVADGFGVRREPSQRVGDGNHMVTVASERADYAIPTG